MKKFFSHIILLILALFGAGWEAYAQTLPHSSWAEVNVSENSIHSYTVSGDENVALPSNFVWVASGGTLYADALATILAGDGTTVQVNGETGNRSTLFVKWDVDGAGPGYVYAYEISSFGCQQPIALQSKYTGVRVNKVAAATTRFLANASSYCSDDGGTYLAVELKGLAPFNLTYTIGGETQPALIVQQSELVNLDEDGLIDDYRLNIPGWAGTTTETNIIFMIESISSDGVEGSIGTSVTHTVTIHPLPIINDIEY